MMSNPACYVSRMDKNTLIQVGEWAQSRVASGEEPPWTFHKLQQLADLALGLAEGMDASTTYVVEKSGPVCESAMVEENDIVVSLDRFRSTSNELQIVLPS